MADESGIPAFDIPAECIAGVVVNEGPNFEVQVKKVPVPEIGKLCLAFACSLPLGHPTHAEQCSDRQSQDRTMSSSS